jgi:hypothetical protein
MCAASTDVWVGMCLDGKRVLPDLEGKVCMYSYNVSFDARQAGSEVELVQTQTQNADAAGCDAMRASSQRTSRQRSRGKPHCCRWELMQVCRSLSESLLAS